MIELGAVVVLAAVVLWLVLGARGGSRSIELADEAPPVEETRRGQSLLALKELEFDHATGKLSDPDYTALKSKYTTEALAALGSMDGDPAERLVAVHRALLQGDVVSRPPTCPSCGPRPELDATFCSQCGTILMGKGKGERGSGRGASVAETPPTSR